MAGRSNVASDVTMAAPVGVTISIGRSLHDAATGAPAMRNQLERGGRGTGISPWAERTVPAPAGSGEQ